MISNNLISNQSVLTFDGIDDNLTLPKDFPTIDKAITIEFWAKGENSLTEQTTILEATNGQNARVLNVHLPWKHTENTRIFWDAGNDSGFDRIDKEVKLEEYNSWTHWAFVKDASTGKMFIYRNGEIWHQSEGNTKTLSGIQKFVIASYVNGGHYWKGCLTEFRIWNIARTQTEIQQNMNSRQTGNETGLVGYYPLNGDSNDKTSNANHGTINGNAIWRQEELPIQAVISDEIESNVITDSNTPTTNGIADSSTTNNSVLAFDGIDDDLTIPKGFPTIDKAITIEFWAKGENSLKQTTTIFNACNAQGNRLTNAHLPWGGQIYWDAGDENGSFDRINKVVKLKEYNVWIHWAFVKDVTTGKMSIYRQGEIWHQGEEQKKSLAGIEKLIIGCFSNYSLYWKGSLTEFRIWNIARTPEEIKQNMNSRQTGNEPGLVGYYPLNGDSNDKTSNANHGTINGAIWKQEELPFPLEPAITSSQPQIIQPVLTFNGIYDCVELAKGFPTIDKTITIEFWAKGENILTQATSIIEAYNAQNTRVLNIHFPWGGRIYWDAGNENGCDRIDKEVKLEEYNEWTHWAFVKDVTTGKMLIYRNGEVWNQGDNRKKSLVGGVNKFVIGCFADYNNFWKGSLTELRIWNTARTSEEIKLKMNSRLVGDEPGLVSYYPLSADSNDKTSNANHGFVHSGIWTEEELPLPKIVSSPPQAIQPAPRNIQSVLMFDGIDDRIELAKGLPTIDKAITIEFWAKGENILTQTTSIIEAYNAQNTRVLNIHLPWGGRIYWDAGNENGFDRIDKEVKPEEYNSWTHWTFVKDPNIGNGKMLIYRNGEIWVVGYNRKKSLLGGVNKFVIGCFANYNNFWKGSLTELRIWNTARTSEEIKSKMNSRLVGDEPGLVSYYPLSADSNDKTSNANHGIINGAIWKQEELPIQTQASKYVLTAPNLPTDSKIKLKSWKGDYLHRPDTAQDVTTWSTGVGNEWTVEALGDNKIKLKSWKGDYLHRPDTAQGVTTWSTGVGNEWTVEALGDNKIKLKSWKGDYLHRPDTAQGVTTWSTGVGNEWELELISITNVEPINFPEQANVLSFDGIDDYIKLPDGILTASYTKEAWIKLSEPPAQFNNIISGNQHALYVPNAIASGHNGQWAMVQTPQPCPKNTWLHVAVTYNSQTLIMCLYQNGQLVSQASNVPPFDPSDRTLKIGVHQGNSFFKGEIAEARIWNFARSQQMIQETMSYRLTGQETGLVAYFPLNEGSGNVATDKTNQGDNGTINGAIWKQEELPIQATISGEEVATQPQVSKFVKIGTKGGSISATDFEFLPTDTAPKSRLKTILINALWPICSLQIEYENIASSSGETYLSALVGNSLGTGGEFSLQPGDYLIKVSGTWGSQAPGYPKEEIITLQFETKKGVKSPVFGGKSGTQEIVEAFLFEAPEGQEIIGFFGSHGGPQNFLVRLGIYCQPISISENQQPTEPVQPTESLVIPENQQPTEPVQPTESAVIPKNQQSSQQVLKLRKGFSFDEAILMATLSKYAYDVFQHDDGSVDDVELKTVYKALYKNQGWQLVHTVRNDDTNIRGLILKNTQSGVAHQYAVSLRGTSVNDKDTVNLDNIAADVDWKLIDYGALSTQRAKVVQGLHLSFESVADEIQFFFKTLRSELKPSDFRRLHQLPPLRKFACITALANAGAIRLGAEFEQQAQDLIGKVVADGEIDNDEELEKILQFVEEQLLSKLSPLTEPIEVWVTGYSLGAALCQLAGLSLRRSFGSASAGGLLIKVYAIAAPKIGNQQFVDYYNKQIGADLSYRIENVLDIVPTYPYDPPFPISAIAPEGLLLGNVYIGKYANGGEAITVMGLGSGQSASISFGGLFSIPFSVPSPHSPETYIELLQEQKQFWHQLVRPAKDIARPFLLELLRDE